MCSNNNSLLECVNGGHCSLFNTCVCVSACFVGDFCEIKYNAARLPLTGAIVQDPAGRDAYIFAFVLLAVCGFINNILALTTFVRARIRITIWGIYLIVFSILSLILMITILSYIMTIARYNNGTYRLLACHAIPFVSLVTIDGGILCTAAIAVERVFIECWNFNINGSRLRALLISLLIVLYACASNLDDIFIRHISSDLMGNKICTYDFDGHPTWRRFDIVFSYAHFIVPLTLHLICSVCVLTTIARRKIFIRSTEDKLHRVWLQQLFIHKDFFIPPLCLILCILPHGILGHLLHTCIPYFDKSMIRLHISFVLFLFVPQTLTFVLYVYPNGIYRKEFKKTIIYRTMCCYACHKRLDMRERRSIQPSWKRRTPLVAIISEESSIDRQNQMDI